MSVRRSTSAAARLLRRHVGDLALELAGARLAAGAADGLGHAEVDQLHDAVVRARGCSAARRRGARAGAGRRSRRASSCAAWRPAQACTMILQREADGDLGLVLPRRLVDDGERLAVDPLHHDVEDLVLLAEVEDLGDVGVVDLGGERRLVEEHLLELRVLAERRQHRLDGHGLVEAARTPLARGPHRRHAPLRDRERGARSAPAPSPEQASRSCSSEAVCSPRCHQGVA